MASGHVVDPRAHWEGVYQTKAATDVSWYQAEPTLSLELITSIAPDTRASILDVGGGSSTLVDHLMRAGYKHVSVLDIAGAALAQARQRLGAEASRVTWIEANVLSADLAVHSIDVWHDRAAFHFLTAPEDRRLYIAQLRRALKPGGHALMATFAEDGPARCSGLNVMRYSPEALHRELAEGCHLLTSRREVHQTPWGAPQVFTYIVCRYTPLSA